MPDAHEQMERAEIAKEVSREDRKIALVIAILALLLSFSETLGKSAQTEAISANVKSSDTWAFFQAKDIRRTVVNAAADETTLLGATLTDPAAKAAIDKQVEAWRATAARYESDPKTGEGRKELAARAKAEEEERDRRHGEIPPLRNRLRGVSDRHRALLGGGDHRHHRAGVVRGFARGPRGRRAVARRVRAASPAAALESELG